MRLIKKAVGIGNGAAVYVPREYMGKEVVVILPEGIKEIKHRVLNELIDFMPNILGVYLYGSYARDEQELGSDIDILVITKEKDENIKQALKNIDARVVSIEGVKKSIKDHPVLIMPILKEAEVLLNPVLLEELNTSKIDFRKFSWNFGDIKRIIRIIETFVDLDDKDIAPSHIYSLILRIRVCYIMEGLLENKQFTNKAVIDLLLEYGLKRKQVQKFFNIYRLVRDDQKITIKITKEEVLRLTSILKNYSSKLENETQKKIRKRN